MSSVLAGTMILCADMAGATGQAMDEEPLGRTDLVAEVGFNGNSGYRFVGVFHFPRAAGFGGSVAYLDDWDPASSSEIWLGVWVPGVVIGVTKLRLGGNLVVERRDGEPKTLDVLVAAFLDSPMAGTSRLRGRYFARLPLGTAESIDQTLEALVVIPIGQGFSAGVGYGLSVSTLDDPSHWPVASTEVTTSLGTFRSSCSTSGVGARWARAWNCNTPSRCPIDAIGSASVGQKHGRPRAMHHYYDVHKYHAFASCDRDR